MKLEEDTTTYTNVVSLADAKAHLRVDTTLMTLDHQPINTAGEIVEQYTGHLEQLILSTMQTPSAHHEGPWVLVSD